MTLALMPYSSHPCILMLPSALFYADSLIACASLPRAQPSPVQWKRLPRSDFPLLFVGTESQDLFVDDGVSWFNEGEQAVVVRLVQDLVRSGAGRVQPREIRCDRSRSPAPAALVLIDPLTASSLRFESKSGAYD